MGVEGIDGDRSHADRLSIRGLEGGHGLRIDDRIQRRRCEIWTGKSTDPVSIREHGFEYPVDAAVRITTDRLTFEEFSRTFVHDGSSVTEVNYFESASYGPGEYTIELSGPVKLYARVQGPLWIESDLSETTVRFEDGVAVRLGARSYHERPATTVTTTENPTDVMAAVSTFGSAMKTTGSDRSYPTLRGHPPALRLGDGLGIPAGLDPPETDVRIEVPETLRAVLAVAPLAYYLGAEVGPGAEPRVDVDGEAFPLESDDGFEAAVERTLKRTFFLDCIVRTAGPRATPLYERRAVAESLEFDVGDLHGQSGAERLATYMAVPYADVAEHLPTWKLTAHVDPVGSSLEVLPFLVDDLAVIHSTSASGTPRDGGSTTSVSDDTVDDPVRSPIRRSPSDLEPTEQSVQPARTDSLEQAWVGSEAPVGASKAMPDAFRNRLDRPSREDEIDIVVVCNDAGMLEERDGVEDVYGARESLPIDVTFYEELTTERLALLLESEVDFLHYIGHVDAGGFECTDGMLEAGTLDAVGVDIFFLNACRSYEQGRRLVEKGAIAGVATLDDVINSGAVRIGETLAELLDDGFPLRSALDIARQRSIVGSQYLVIGDGNADIGQHQGNVPVLADVTSTDDGYELEITTYTTSGFGMGTQFRTAVPGVDDVYLCPGTLPTFTVSEAALEEYLSRRVFPVRFDGRFTWSDGVALTGEK